MKSIATIGVVLGLLLLLFMGGCSSYNGFVDSEENVDKAWADVQTQYQRRADLFMNLVETVKGAAANEKDILIGVVDSRTGAANYKDMIAKAQSPADLESVGQKINSQINVIFERYPEIRSTDNFSSLQAQIEGTENRISVARQKFNEVVTSYNKKVRRFPASFFASIFGFAEKAQFEAQAGSDQAPKVSF
ncbi:MAG: LemA family protein [Bacteroidetes bacterium]|nr:MAG: LemA family protein [Bacteroidota bacterium]PTM12823.1 MAG: LemA family protein [Bacteroidota bacterium]